MVESLSRIPPGPLTQDEVSEFHRQAFQMQEVKGYRVIRPFFGPTDTYCSIAETVGMDEKGRTLADKLLGLKGTNPDILDIGCGTGVALQEIHRELEQATCIGISADTHFSQPEGTRFLYGDAQDLPSLLKTDPTVPQTYDFITAVHVAEHMADPLALIEGTFKVLKPGGYAFISHFPVKEMSGKEREKLAKRLRDVGVTVFSYIGSPYLHLYMYKFSNSPQELDLGIDRYPPKPLSFWQQHVSKSPLRLQYRVRPQLEN